MAHELNAGHVVSLTLKGFDERTISRGLHIKVTTVRDIVAIVTKNAAKSIRFQVKERQREHA